MQHRLWPAALERRAAKQPGTPGSRPYERDSTMGSPAAKQRAPPSPWPPSARGHDLSFKQANKEARASKYSPPRAYYPDRRVVTSTGLALRRVWRVRGID